MLPNTKTHRKSLSPKQKGQIKSIDAAAQKKQYELLPPEKKAKLMETKTEQRKSFPPEKKIKFLETDADAHKKKQESLSPKDKDLFDKNNTAAQHKYHKSLSSDQKAQVLKTDAAEHKNT